MISIQGQKTFLRDWTLKDLDVFKSWHTGRHQWKEFDAPYFPVDEKEFLQGLEILRERIEKQNFPQPRMRMVIADLESDQLVGTVNAYLQNVPRSFGWICTRGRGMKE